MTAAVRTAPICGCATTGKIVRGMCAIHYDRWVHRTPRERREPAPRFRRQFWDFVDKASSPNGCWLWTGPRNLSGYGTWSGSGTCGLAHRLSLAEVTPAPPGMQACHRCDNPPCVRPAHLYWGTQKDNSRDAVERGLATNGNAQKTHCKRGHPLSGKNLRTITGRKGRVCRTCDNARSAERQRRYREERRGR